MNGNTEHYRLDRIAMRRLRRAAFLLRIVGFVDCLAGLVALLPWRAIETIHQSLGLGSLPAHPTVEYLVRSVSLLHVVFGVLLVFLSYNIVRFTPVIRCVVCLLGITALALIPVDWVSGMPLWWVISQVGGLLAIASYLWWAFCAHGIENHEVPAA
ncbi:MAG: hypothetical protein ACYTGL_16105 [Planctomycetota bacterium]